MRSIERWQKRSDTAVRRNVLYDIKSLLQAKYRSRHHCIIAIARRAEFMLYARSNSIDEYQNKHTLAHRMHFLLRKLAAGNTILVRQGKGRKTYVRSAKPKATSGYFPNANGDIVAKILSFANTKDMLNFGATSKNNYACHFNQVRHIELNQNKVQTLSVLHVVDICKKYTKARTLEITGNPLYSMTTILDALLQVGSMPELRTFRCNSMYTDDLHDSTTKLIVQVLTSISLPKLDTLSLCDNCIADEGATSLAELYLSDLHCPKLSKLELQDNAIGERGQYVLAYTIMNKNFHPCYLYSKIVK